VSLDFFGCRRAKNAPAGWKNARSARGAALAGNFGRLVNCAVNSNFLYLLYILFFYHFYQKSIKIRIEEKEKSIEQVGRGGVCGLR
jgi:hypothetical protein